MSPLLPNMGPPIGNTHDPLPHHELQPLAAALAEAASKQPDGRLPPEAIDEVALQHNKPRAYAWAALALDPNLVPQLNSETLFAICTGKCQLQGAIPNLERLLELRDERIRKEQPLFDIVPRHCLDLCPHAPVALSRSAAGQAAHPKLAPENLPEIIEALCDS